MLASTFNGSQVHRLLVHLSPVDHLLDASNCHESVDYYVFFLTDSVTPVYGLVVIGRVPIWVHNDGSVGTGQIQSKTADFGCQETTKEAFVVVKLLTDLLTGGNLSVTIDTHVLKILTVCRIVLYDELKKVQHLFGNRKD